MVATQDRPLIKNALRVNALVRITRVQPHQSKDWIGQTGTIAKVGRDRIRVTVAGKGSKPVELPLPPDCLELVNDEPVQAAFKVGDLIVGKTATDQVAFGRYKGISPSGLLKVDTGRRTSAVTPESATSVEMPKFAVSDRVVVSAHAPMWVGVEAKITEISSQPEYQHAIKSWSWQWRYLLHGKSHTPENPEHCWVAECYLERLAAAIETATEQTEAKSAIEPLPQPIQGTRFRRGDRVKIAADDDLRNCPAIVDRTFEEDGRLWTAVYCAELPGGCLEYLSSELSFVAGSAPSSLFELGQLMERKALTHEPELKSEAENINSSRAKKAKKPALKVGDRVYSTTDDQQDLTILDIKDGVAICKPSHSSQIGCKLENLRPWKFRFTVADWFTVAEGKFLHFVAEVDHEKSLIGWLSHPCCEAEEIDWVPETSNLQHAKEPDWADLRQTDRVALIRPGQPARLGVIQKIDYSSLTAEMVWDEENADATAALTLLHLWKHDWKLGDRIVQDGNKPEWGQKNRVDSLIAHGTLLDVRLYCGNLTPWVRWETGTQGKESWGIVSQFYRWSDAPAPLLPEEPPITNEAEIIPSHPSSLIPHPSLSDLATQINQLHTEGDEAEATVLAAGKAALQTRKEEGDRLIQAKAHLQHGEWGTWLKDNCPQISDRSARLYMQLAEGWEELSKTATVADLTLREAIKRLPKKQRQQPALTASADEAKSGATPPLEPGTEVYFNSFSGVITKLEGDRAIVKMDDGKFENLELDRLSTHPPDRTTTSTSEWQRGDRLAPKDGGIEGVVVATTKTTVVVNQDDGRTIVSSRLSPKEVRQKFDPVQPKADDADPLKWLDDEFEGAIQLVTEYLGPEQVKKSALQVMQAVRDLGGLPVAILAVRECDRDELMQVQDIVKRMLEET